MRKLSFRKVKELSCLTGKWWSRDLITLVPDSGGDAPKLDSRGRRASSGTSRPCDAGMLAFLPLASDPWEAANRWPFSAVLPSAGDDWPYSLPISEMATSWTARPRPFPGRRGHIQARAIDARARRARAEAERRWRRRSRGGAPSGRPACRGRPRVSSSRALGPPS